MKKFLTVISVIAGILIVLYFVAGYFLGNLPIASALLGTNKPRDLGVKISTDSAYQGLKSLNKPLTAADLRKIAANKTAYTKVKASLSDAEASSLISLADIPNFPFKLVQMKFGDNGEVQASGVINISDLEKTLKDYGASGDVINQVMSIAKNAKWVNFYAEGTCSIKNNKITADLNTLQLGKIGLPEDLVKNNSASVASYVEGSLVKSGYNIRSMSIGQGKVNFDMDRPISSIQPWLKFVKTP